MSSPYGSAGLPIKTVIKYDRTSCYFCNEWLDSQTFKEHLIHCGQVLEPCSNSCGAYVQRKKMRSHLRDCPRQIGKPHLSNGLDDDAQQKILSLEQEISSLRSVLNEEIRQRLHLITDVGSLRKQNQISTEWSDAANDTMIQLQSLINQEIAHRTSAIEECQNDYRYSYDSIQSLKGELQYSFDDVQKQISEISFETKKTQSRISERINEFENNITQQERSLKIKIKQIEMQMNEYHIDLRECLTAANTEVNANHAKMDCEIEEIKTLANETEERCIKLEKIVQNIDKSLHQTLQSLSDLEVNILDQHRMNTVQNTRGHLVWRINDFARKFEEARKFDTVLQSPIFFNKPYGYTLRVDIYLNGKGTWKGRNVIACLNVIPGEYDPLLNWPCVLKADVTIRDQSSDPSSPHDYVKTVSVRRKSDELQSNQFFHIPHKIVNSMEFVKDDTLFFEIRVHKNK